MVVVFVFFFFKQKTAYEMRISDWSSDVCSSDLMGRHGRCVNGTGHGAADNDLTLAHGVNFTSLENLRAILTIIKVSRPCRSTGCHSRGQNSAERSPLYAGTGASDGWYQYAPGGVILSTASLFLP